MRSFFYFFFLFGGGGSSGDGGGLGERGGEVYLVGVCFVKLLLFLLSLVDLDTDTPFSTFCAVISFSSLSCLVRPASHPHKIIHTTSTIVRSPQ